MVTGNKGYIGTVMTDCLKKSSYNVVGLDTDYFKDNLLYPDIAKPDRQILKDIRKISEEDLEGVDAVIHLAGLSNDPLGELNPVLTDEINCLSTLRLARFAKNKGVRRFIFASSCSLYGISQTDKPVDENGGLKPLTAYARAKMGAEEGLLRLADKDFHPVLMRNATVYGVSPKLRLDLVVNNLAAWAHLTGEISIMSDGTPWRPIIHIRDFCNAFSAALNAPAESVHGEAFNVGLDEENYQVKNIAQKIQNALPGSRIKILNKTGGDDRSYRVDFSKIQRVLKEFQPKWDLKRGIEELLEAYRRHDLTREIFDSGRYFRIKAIRSLMENNRITKDLLWTAAVRDSGT